MIKATFDFLRALGIPVCVALLILACIAGATWAENRYALKAEFNLIRETQLAQSIREVHAVWCREDDANKNYWWAELQRYQSSYQSISTTNERYKTPPCPGHQL